MQNKIELIKKTLPKLYSLTNPCRLCPRNCLAMRSQGEVGFCKTNDKIIVASWAEHKGEEPPISGTKGSGTIFSSNCTLGCEFCQNFPFSQLGNGKIKSASELANIFDKLAEKNVHNLNFVTPTHVIPMLLEAWLLAGKKAQSLPIVYNTSGYETIEVLRLLEGIVNIYLPDIKYSDSKIAIELSKIPNYVKANRDAIKEMHRQVGTLELDSEGIATKGLIIRHLILPNNLSGTEKSFDWIKKEIGIEVDVSLMCQYFPAYKAHSNTLINRQISADEYLDAMNYIELLGFTNVRVQDPTMQGGA